MLVAVAAADVLVIVKRYTKLVISMYFTSKVQDLMLWTLIPTLILMLQSTLVLPVILVLQVKWHHFHETFFYYLFLFYYRSYWMYFPFMTSMHCQYYFLGLWILLPQTSLLKHCTTSARRQPVFFPVAFLVARCKPQWEPSCVFNSLLFVFSGVVASADAFDVDSALEFDLDQITGPTSDLTSGGSDLGDQTLPDSLLSPGDGFVSLDTGMMSD